MTERMVTQHLAPRRDPPGTGAEPSLRQIAYDRIEELLNWGKVRPGQVISQRELMEMADVSLGSVREAIPRFEAEGLLLTLPQRGLMVPSLDVTFIREAYQMRRMIELGTIPDILAGVNRNLVTEWIDWHRAAQSRLGQDDGSDLAEFLRGFQLYDWDMHTRMVSVMENRLMSNVYRVTAIKIRMVAQSRVRVTRQNATRVIKEHLAFLHPMLAGDADAATRALSHHIDQSLTLALGGMVQEG